MDLPLCQTNERHQGILPPSVCVTVLEAAAGCKSTGITNEGGLRISYPCSHTSLGSPLVMPQSPRMTSSVIKIIILNKHGEAFQCLSHPWSFCNDQVRVLGNSRNVYHFPTDAHYFAAVGTVLFTILFLTHNSSSQPWYLASWYLQISVCLGSPSFPDQYVWAPLNSTEQHRTQQGSARTTHKCSCTINPDDSILVFASCLRSMTFAPHIVIAWSNTASLKIGQV